MGESAMKMVEDFAKNKLVAYFLLLWAATFFFSAISGFVWLAGGYGSALDIIIEVLWDLADLGCAAVLVMLGLKILNNQEPI